MMSQTERILFLDKKMRTMGRVTVAETADYFEVSTRQVKRDIEYLRDRFDAPIVYDSAERYYHYQKEFKDLEFADQNLVMSYLALQSIASNNQYMPVYAENMMSAINEEVPADYRTVCKKITYQLPLYDAIKPEYFESICASMRDCRCLDITYTNLESIESRRQIEPHHLINYGGTWYVIAYDTAKKALRTFHLSRITSLSLTKEKFEKHPESFKKEISSMVEGGFGIFHGTKTTPIKIRFYDKAARIVSTQTWHPEQIVTRGIEKDSAAKGASSGREYVELEFPAADFTEVLSKIISFGPSARPVAPKELVTLWKEEIASMMKLVNGSVN
jgi:predicted DNA-binding transcriptional regulator YafY